ncbi:hypothetical protein HY522_02265 [bacterium]|nr:hypothetical protein [bacterium]
MMEAKFWMDAIHNRSELIRLWSAGQLNAAELQKIVDGLPPVFTPKPLHGLAIALFSILTGVQDEWVGCLWSAILGTAAIGFLGVWTARRFGPATGLLAAFLLACSRSHVMYSRSQLAESDALTFLLVPLLLHIGRVLDSTRPVDAVAFHTRSEPSPIRFGLLLGILYGLAISTNYRCLPMIPLLFVWDFFTVGLLARPKPRPGSPSHLAFGQAFSRFRFPTTTFYRMCGVIAGLALIIGFFELPYRIYIWRGGSLPEGVQTYAQTLFSWFWGINDPTFESNGVLALFQPHLKLFIAFMTLDGPWWVGGLILGFIFCLKAPNPARISVLGLAFLPLFGFSLLGRGDGPRAVMTSIPFFVILSAVGWLEAARRFEAARGSVRRFGTKILLTALLVPALAGSWKETQVSSAWPAVGRWLKAESPGMVYTTYPLAVGYYLRKDRARLAPAGSETPAGIWVIDRYHATYAYPYLSSVGILRSQQAPEEIFDGQVYPATGLFFDWTFFRRGGAPVERVKWDDWKQELDRPDMGRIEIYRVKSG